VDGIIGISDELLAQGTQGRSSGKEEDFWTEFRGLGIACDLGRVGDGDMAREVYLHGD